MPNARYRFMQEVIQLPSVRAAIARVADEKARQAQRIANAEGARVTVQRVDGTRPKGRPYAQIAIPATLEFGDSKTKRYRILGRVLGMR